MSWRALLLGFLAGLWISAFTYFNDMIMGQTRLIGSAFPISVFGGAAFLVLVINPLLRRIGSNAPMRAGEIAVATAIALAACSFPGQTFFEYFTAAVSQPSHQQLTQPSWHANRILSYLPGGSHEIAMGHVQDWQQFAAAVEAQKDQDTPVGRLWQMSREEERRLWSEARTTVTFSDSEARTLLNAVNRILAEPGFVEGLPASATARERVEAGRAALVEALPHVILPPPRGEGGLVNGGFADDDIIRPAVVGWRSGELLPVGRVPWDAWWPSIRTWVGGALCLTLAVLCLAVVVHPQWAQRELLSFPIPRFFELLSRRTPGNGLPDIATSKLFWIGFGAMVVLHLVNGLNAWFPELPRINRTLDLTPLRTLFPNMARTPFNGAAVFNPTIYFSVVAFAFFVNRTVSLSMGLTPLIFAVVGGALISQGIAVEYARYQPSDMNFLRFGAHVVIIGAILYSGRRYYLDVLRGTLGVRQEGATPGAIWAARGFVVLSLAAVALFGMSGLSPLMSASFVLLVLITWIVHTRVVTETGMFLMAGPFAALGILPSLFGEAVVGPTQLILLGLIGFIMLGDVKESLMPMVLNGMEMARRTGESTRKLVPALITMLVVGCVVALVVSVTLMYEYGLTPKPNTNAAISGGQTAINTAMRVTAELESIGRLPESTAMTDLDRLRNAEPEGSRLVWALAGGVLTLLCSVARLRLPWWPIHPLIFVVIGTWGISVLGFSFLLGWAVTSAVVRLGGVRMHHTVAPLMVGIVAGELLMGLGWMITGAVYYFATGQAPSEYIIFSP